GDQAVETQRSWLDESSQGLPPVCLCLRLVATAQPGDIIAECTRRLRFRLSTAPKRLVVVEKLVEQDREAPAVDHDVVDAPDELVQAFSELEERHPGQWRARGGEAAPTVGIEVGPELFLLVDPGNGSPISEIDPFIDLAVYDLISRAKSRPVDRRS